MQIGVLGAGRMSAPLVANLASDGHDVAVWNRTRAKAEALCSGGVRTAETPAGVAMKGGVVLSCVADDFALDEVFGDGQVLAALGTGGLHVSMSTVSATCAARHAKTHREAGVAYVAAPICGRPEAVAARMQTHLIAGDRGAKARAQEVLGPFARQVFDFGDEPHRANVAKINFNFLIASAVEAMAEAFAVVEKSGLDARAFYEMAIGTAFGCPLYEGYGRQICEQGWDTAGFTTALGLKDVRLAAETAAACGARMRLGELLEARFSEAVENGLADKDWTSIASVARSEAGL